MIKQVLFYVPTFLLFVIIFVLIFLKNQNKFKILIQKKLIWILLVLCFINGTGYIFKMPLSPIDEINHFAYIQFLVEEKKLPHIKDLMSKESLAIATGTYPRPPMQNGKEISTQGFHIYEAFQPPLYYLLSTPIYQLGGMNFNHKLKLIRFWGLIQLLAVVFLTYKICQKIKLNNFSANSLLHLVAILIVGFTPTMVVRATTGGNAILPIIFICLVILKILNSLNENKKIKLKDVGLIAVYSAGAVLSRFTAIFILPLILLFIIIQRKKILLNSAVFAIIFSILLLPWISFNYSKYHSLTPNKAAQEFQRAFAPGFLPHYDLEYVKKQLSSFFLLIYVPEEYNLQVQKYFDPYFFPIAKHINFFSLLGLTTFITLIFSNLKKSRQYQDFFVYSLLIFFVITNILMLIVGTLSADWPLMQGRYLHTTLPLVAVFFAFFLILVQEIKYKFLRNAFSFVVILLPLLLNLEYVYFLLHQS